MVSGTNDGPDGTNYIASGTSNSTETTEAELERYNTVLIEKTKKEEKLKKKLRRLKSLGLR